MMKNSYNQILLASGCVLLLLTGCVTAKQKLVESGVQPMTGNEISELFSQPTNVSYSGPKGSATIHHMPDGTQKIDYPGGTDEGNWRVNGDDICGKWQKLRSGSEQCSSMFKISENTYKFFGSDGSYRGTLTFN